MSSVDGQFNLPGQSSAPHAVGEYEPADHHLEDPHGAFGEHRPHGEVHPTLEDAIRSASEQASKANIELAHLQARKVWTEQHPGVAPDELQIMALASQFLGGLSSPAWCRSQFAGTTSPRRSC